MCKNKRQPEVGVLGSLAGELHDPVETFRNLTLNRVEYDSTLFEREFELFDKDKEGFPARFEWDNAPNDQFLGTHHRANIQLAIASSCHRLKSQPEPAQVMDVQMSR